MKIPFEKMHGIGNDFILINKDNIPDHINLNRLAAEVCHRHFGIGADGLMVAEKSLIAESRMLYFNSDGSQGEMCGNGVRCFARFILDRRNADPREITVETTAGVLSMKISTLNDFESLVEVNMGRPEIFELNNKLEINEQEICYHYVVLGVPHVVIFHELLHRETVETLGPAIEKHPHFPEGTNVNFVKIINRQQVQLMTWERGAGHTLACGTGISSAVFVAQKLGMVGDHTQVQAEGGRLLISCQPNGVVQMTGSAQDICVGEYIVNWT
mgnify:CR=1 FL=1